MIHHRDIHKIQAFIFMQRLYAYLLVLRYVQLLAKSETPSPSAGEGRARGNEPDVKYNYSYDNIYRLTQTVPIKLNYKIKEEEKEHEAKAESFAYDAVGNRLRGPDTRDFYSYNQINQLTEDRKNSYEYDKNGNLTKKTEKDDDGKTETWTYGYDYENRLIKVVGKKEDETKTVSFKYDPFGRRIEKKVEEVEDGKTETKIYDYVYDNEDIILEYDGSGNIGNRYIHGPGIDEPLALTNNMGTYYYHADGLGSITTLTDKKQKVVESYTYDSFGNMKRKGDKVKNTFTYTAREWDNETGLYYYRARYYDPRVGRFVSEDPIGFGGGINLYTYVGNNAVNWKDPLGLVAPVIALEACLANPACAAALGTAVAATGLTIQQLLSELIEKMKQGKPITPEEIKNAPKEREKEIKQCKTGTGTPPNFHGPDPNKVPEDPKLKWKLIIVRLLQLISKYIPHQ